MQACVEFLINHLDHSNCLGIKAFADKYNYEKLFLVSEDFIKRQFMYEKFNLISHFSRQYLYKLLIIFQRSGEI